MGILKIIFHGINLRNRLNNIPDLEDSGIQDQRNSSLSSEIAHPHGNKPQWIFESQGASKVSTRIQDTPKNVSWNPHPVKNWFDFTS